MQEKKKKIDWKKPKYEQIEWIKKDPDSVKAMEEDLLPKIGKKICFNGLMKKIKVSQDKVLKKSKRIKVGKK